MLKRLRLCSYIIGFLFFRPISYILPLKLSLKILYKFRKLFYPFFTWRKKRALHIFSLCFPEMDRDTQNKILDKLMWSTLIYPFIDIYLDHIPRGIKHMIDVYNFQEIRKLAIDNKAFILLFCHNGFQNIVLPFSGSLRPIYTVVGFFYDELDIVSKLQNYIRVGMQKKLDVLKYIYIKKDSLVQLRIVKLLKEGKIVAISSDGTYSTKFYEVSFLNGYRLLVPTGAYRISVSLKVPILPIFSYFDEKDFKIKVIYGNIIKGDNPYTIAQEYWKVFTSFLRSHPEGWTGWWRILIEKDKLLRLSAI